MKYVLLFCADGDDVRRFATMSEPERADQLARVGAWFAGHSSRITGGRQLALPNTATTVRFKDDGEPLLTDGAFLESHEVIGGYAEIETPATGASWRSSSSSGPSSRTTTGCGSSSPAATLRCPARRSWRSRCAPSAGSRPPRSRTPSWPQRAPSRSGWPGPGARS